MKPVFLSIIIPVYNVEKYLRQCLDSVLNQTFQDWELLLIDDGSPDHSGAICDEYAEKDNRIRVFHKANGGVSSARNLGLDNAKGTWVTFIDADDFISPTFIEALVKPTIEHPDIDLIQGGCTNWKDGATAGINQLYEDYIGTEPDIVFGKFRGLTFSKLFSLENVNQWSDGLPLRFDERMKIAEDMAFTLDYLMTVKKYAFVSEVGYFYRKDNLLSATKLIKYPVYNEERISFTHLWSSTCNYIAKFNLIGSQSEYRYRQRAEEFIQLLKSIYYSNFNHTQRLAEIKKLQETDAYRIIIKVVNDNRELNLLRNNEIEKFDKLNLRQYRVRLFKDKVKVILRFILAGRLQR